MAGGTELAGVIGTWVAVSLALFALFGIVTPILLIRRARSERHIALSKIEDGSNEIVQSGIKIPLLPVIARKIHAPDLQAPPELAGHVLGRDDTILNRNPSGTGWVMFTRTLKAYNIAQHPKGTLKIYQTQSWLPVHRLWILTVGLLGRYAHRPDRGRLINAPPPGRVDQRRLGSSDRNALYGITGVLRYRAPEGCGDVEQDFGQIYFSSHDNETRGSFEPDSVPLADLFWSCMGCVRLPDGRVFDISREQVTRQRYRSPNSSRAASITHVLPTSLPTYRFQLIDNSNPTSEILSLAQRLLGELPELWWMCEYKVTATEDRVEIERIIEDSDDPEGISSPWIKTSSLEVARYFDSSSLLWRTDVQCLALGILKMEWSPRGRLFDARRGHFSRRVLCPASASFPALLQASFKICETATSPTPARTNLNGLLKRILPMYTSRISSEFSRALHETLYDFEKALDSNYMPGFDSMAIGVIFITSKTFRDFVLGTATEKESHSHILILNPISKSFTISAPGTYLDKEFVLDFEVVFNEALPAAPVSFTHLLNFVGRMEDVVYVSALPNVPVSQRNRAAYSPALTPAPSILAPSVLVPSFRESSDASHHRPFQYRDNQSPVPSIYREKSMTDITTRSEELRIIARGTEPSDNITPRIWVPPTLAPSPPGSYRTIGPSDSCSDSGNPTRSHEPTSDSISGRDELMITRRPTESTNNSTTPIRIPSPRRTFRAEESTYNHGVRFLTDESTNNFMDPRPQNDEDQRHGGRMREDGDEGDQGRLRKDSSELALEEEGGDEVDGYSC